MELLVAERVNLLQTTQDLNVFAVKLIFYDLSDVRSPLGGFPCSSFPIANTHTEI